MEIFRLKDKSLLVLGIGIVALIIGFALTLEPWSVIGEVTGEIGGVLSVIGIMLYCGWIAWKTLGNQDPSVDDDNPFLHPSPTTDKLPHEESSLSSDQTALLKKLVQSHRLFIANFVGTLILIPSIAIWTFLFLVALAPPIERFVIEGLMIAIPLSTLILILGFKSKSFLYYFQSIQKYLDLTKLSIESGEGEVNITTYVNLLFSVLRAGAPLTEQEPARQIRLSRSYLRIMQILPIVEITVFGMLMLTMGVLFTSMWQYILNPIFQLFIITFFFGIGGIMIIRWIIFLLWRRLMGRWLNLYVALTKWRMTLEQNLLGDQTSLENGG